MTISDAGLALIKSSEGFRSHVYNDVAAIPTIGYGHKLLPGESFPDGITEDDATALLRLDLVPVERTLTELVEPEYNCTQGQWDALADFGYNLGVGALRTMMAHGWMDIPNQLPRWDHAGGEEVPGLKTRRQRELEMFEGRK